MPLLFLIFVICAPTGLAFFPPLIGFSSTISWAGIGLVATILPLMFASTIYSGVNKDRNILSLISISILGICTIVLNFANIYIIVGINSPDGCVSNKFFDSLYFSVVTWTTLGYGDFTPTEAARPVAIAQISVGVLIMALFIASLVAALTRK